MTVAATRFTGALSDRHENWHDIIWALVQKSVRRLQVRIAKAVREGRHRKAKAIQWILTHSYHAKVLAVKRVVSNKCVFRRFRPPVPKESGHLNRSKAATRRSEATLVADFLPWWPPWGQGFNLLRIDSPSKGILWELWTRRSRMASAKVGSPRASCQFFTGS